MTKLEQAWGETVKAARNKNAKDTFSITLDQTQTSVNVSGFVIKSFYGSGLYEQYIQRQERQLKAMKILKENFDKTMEYSFKSYKNNETSDINASGADMFFSYDFWVTNNVDKDVLRDTIENFFMSHGFNEKTR